MKIIKFSKSDEEGDVVKDEWGNLWELTEKLPIGKIYKVTDHFIQNGRTRFSIKMDDGRAGNNLEIEGGLPAGLPDGEFHAKVNSQGITFDKRHFKCNVPIRCPSISYIFMELYRHEDKLFHIGYWDDHHKSLKEKGDE